MREDSQNPLPQAAHNPRKEKDRNKLSAQALELNFLGVNTSFMLISYVTLENLPKVCVAEFPHLWNENNDSTYFMGLL